MTPTMLGIGVIGGICGGLIGIGGSSVIIPALVLLFGFSQKLAQGTSIAAMIPPIGILAAYTYWKSGNIDVKAAAFIAVGFVLGGLIGGLLAQHLSDNFLRKFFATLLVLVAIKMWLGK
jgi:uncharacterized protein